MFSLDKQAKWARVDSARPSPWMLCTDILLNKQLARELLLWPNVTFSWAVASALSWQDDKMFFFSLCFILLWLRERGWELEFDLHSCFDAFRSFGFLNFFLFHFVLVKQALSRYLHATVLSYSWWRLVRRTRPTWFLCNLFMVTVSLITVSSIFQRSFPVDVLCNCPHYHQVPGELGNVLGNWWMVVVVVFKTCYLCGHMVDRLC